MDNRRVEAMVKTMRMTRTTIFLLFLLASALIAAQTPGGASAPLRPLAPDDLFSLKDVGDPQLSLMSDIPRVE
jgi:hypothetical protein